MYTQCSKCETVFKLSAEVLRTAGGQVRCGKCGEVFSALARLAEDASAFTVGESALDLETRADMILESAETVAVARTVAKDYEEFSPSGAEVARLQVVDWPEEDSPEDEQADEDDGLDPQAGDSTDRSMEYTLPPGDLDRIFVEFKKRAPRPKLPADQSEAPPPEPAAESAPKPAHPLPPAPAPVPAPQPLRMLPDLDYGLEPQGPLEFAGTAAALRRRRLAWLSAAIVLTLALMVQMVHHNRDWFMAHAQGPGGGALRAFSGLLGAPLAAPANLSAYQLRQWGVTGDPDANGTLRLRASILNTAAQLQPYPLLRVTLADRFGKSIGRRDFAPAEYLGRPTAKLLAPGERVDATLAILDPGKNAEGFEVDVCLNGAEQKLACANDSAPQPKK